MNAAKRYKDIELPFTCPITNRVFNTTKGLSVYVTKTLKMNHMYYYDRYINHRDSICFFCYDKGKFISLGKGYRNLCEKEECIKKSFSSHTVDGFMYKNMCSREDAEILYEIENKRQLSERMKTFSTLRESNPDFDKERNVLCKEFWIKKGYCDEESLLKISEIRKENALKFSETIKSDPEKYASKYPTKIEYYLNKGISEENALKKISEIQNRFSLVGCIEKHGDIEGNKIWQDRQDKWMATMDSKTDEEKIEINRKKLFNNSGYSKISQKLFWDIYKNFENDVKFEELNGEVIRYDKCNNKHYRFDYVDFSKKKVIEFNGDFWHCNPSKYNESFKHSIMNMSAREIWEKDKIKIDWINKRGYKVLIIWESDYRKNPKQTLQKCIEFIND